MNAACHNSCNEVNELGGDVNAVVSWLRERTDQGWKYQLQIDDDHLSSNVSTNVRTSLGAEFTNFNHDFWATY